MNAFLCAPSVNGGTVSRGGRNRRVHNLNRGVRPVQVTPAEDIPTVQKAMADEAYGAFDCCGDGVLRDTSICLIQYHLGSIVTVHYLQ